MEVLDIKSKWGYTLLELLVVLALFAIILSIAIPSTKVIFNTKENDELNRFRREVLFIRTSAIVENCTYILTLDEKKNSYIISKENALTNKKEKIKTIEFKDGIVLEKSDAPKSISFKPTGAPSIGTTIYLTNRKKQDIKMTIAPATGSVNLKIDKSN